MRAVLIGFQYSGDKFLPGVQHDLRRMMRWAKKRFSAIDVIDDHNFGDLRRILTNEVMFVYFTGHGVKGAILLPDRGKFKITSFLKRCPQMTGVFDCCGLGDHLDPRILTSSTGLEPTMMSENGSPFTYEFCRSKREISTTHPKN